MSPAPANDGGPRDAIAERLCVGPANVGLLGPQNAGKTTFLAVLERALRDREWQVGVDPGAGNRHLLDEIRSSLNSGYWPGKTLVKGRSDDFKLHLRQGERQFDLSFYDPPGELFELNDEPDAIDAAQARESYFQHLTSCTGLVVLFDLTRSTQSILDSWRASVESYQAFLRRTKPSALDRGRLPGRLAIVFTKADLLPWIRRHRQRNAGEWLKAHPGLKELHADAGLSSQSCRFYFASAVGWDEGAPGCRTAVRPRRLDLDGAAQVSADRDLIPDPPARSKRDATSTTAPLLPLFTDPLQLVDERTVSLSTPEAGVIMLPGRNVGRDDQRPLLTPWNIVEPLLWAAGQRHER